MLRKESMLDHVNDYYIKDLNKIQGQLADMRDDLLNIYKKISKGTPAAKKDRKLRDFCADAAGNIADLQDHLANTYEGIEHYA